MTTKLNRQSGRSYWPAKMPLELKNQLDLIRIERIKRNKDRQPRSYQRLTLAITRNMQRNKQFVEDLINADLKEGDLQ